MKTTARALAALVISGAACGVALVGCGGGGGGSSSSSGASSTPPLDTAEGYWSGTTSTGWNVDLAILENGETWGIYSTNGVIYGALFGTTTSNAGSLSGSGTDFYFPDRSASAGTYSGSYVRATSLKATTSTGVVATVKYVPSYDQAANLSTVSGTFNGWGLTKTSAVTAQTVTITSAGALSGGITGCAVSGTLTPRPSGKGVFNVSLALTGPVCAAGSGVAMQGVLTYDPTARRLAALGLNAAKTDGFFFIGNN